MPEIPRVSVVMPVHNGGAYLQHAVDSILGQTFTDFEFVIIDDGSTDATAEVLRHYQVADNRLRVHHQEKAGLVASLNRGCSQARAAYIARMDADDIAYPDRQARQVEFLVRHPREAVVGSAVVRIDASGREIKQNACPTSHAEIVEALREYTCFTHPSVMLRAAALVVVGGYRPAYGPAEDYDLWLRLSEQYELANLPDPLLYYRVYPGQVSVRQLDQQILSVVGARAAARQRALTGSDGSPADELITAELLRKWGVPETAVADAMGRGYCYAAYVMLQIGRADEAIELLRTGWHLSHGRGGLGAMLAGACSKQAKTCFLAGRVLAGLSWGVEAWRAQPTLPFHLLRNHLIRTRAEIGSAGANP
jgi:glycosyltransferase involved in cell wall biosynthesis